MIGNLKALGLVALTALAASATLASGAQAQLGTLTAGETPETHEPATIVAQQYGGLPASEEGWNFFSPTTGAGPEGMVTCDSAKLTDTTDDGTASVLTSVEVDPIHCQAAAQPATVEMNGCEYTIAQLSTVRTDVYTGTVSLTCPEDSRMEAKVYLFGNSTNTSHSFQLCTFEVWPNAEPEEGHRTQELGGHIILQNVDPAEGPDDLTAKLTLTEITSFDGCQTGKHHTNGTYKQTLTVKAFADEGEHADQLALWIGDE